MSYPRQSKTRFEGLTDDEVLVLVTRLQNESREIGLTKQELRLVEILLRAPVGMAYNEIFDRLYHQRTFVPSSRGVIRTFITKARQHLKNSKTGVQIHVDWRNKQREVGVLARPWPDPGEPGAEDYPAEPAA